MPKLIWEVLNADPDGYTLGIHGELIDGGAAGNFVVPNLQRGADLIAVIEFAVTSNNPTDRKSQCSVNDDGTLLVGTSTVNDKLLVIFVNSRT